MPELQSTEAPVAELHPARDLVRAKLLRDILHGNLPLPTENEPLSENAVMERYRQQSRMPVRMALAVLSGEGVIRQRARHGFWLIPYDTEDVEQILRMRAGIEAMVAEALCDLRTGSEQATPPDLADSRASFWEAALASQESMETLAAAVDDDSVDPEFEAELEAEFADSDTQFHSALARAAGYDVASRHITEWRNQVRIFRLQNEVRYDASAMQTIIAEHSALIEAITTADGPLAADLARSHVENALSRERVVTAVEHVLRGNGLRVERKPDIGDARPDLVAREQNGTTFVIQIKHRHDEADRDVVDEIEELRSVVAGKADHAVKFVVLMVGSAGRNLDRPCMETGKADIEIAQVEPGRPGSIRESLKSLGVVRR